MGSFLGSSRDQAWEWEWEWAGSRAWAGSFPGSRARAASSLGSRGQVSLEPFHLRLEPGRSSSSRGQVSLEASPLRLEPEPGSSSSHSRASGASRPRASSFLAGASQARGRHPRSSKASRSGASSSRFLVLAGKNRFACHPFLELWCLRRDRALCGRSQPAHLPAAGGDLSSGPAIAAAVTGISRSHSSTATASRGCTTRSNQSDSDMLCMLPSHPPDVLTNFSPAAGNFNNQQQRPGMGAQPGQSGQPGGMPLQQAGMQTQGIGAPGEAARSVPHFFWDGGMERHLSAHSKCDWDPVPLTLQAGCLDVARFRHCDMQHAGRTLLRCGDMLQSACHRRKLQ